MRGIMANIQTRIVSILSIILAVALAAVSYCGAFITTTYERDAISMAAQGVGQDIFDLLVVVPLLLISLLYMNRGNRAATFVFSGTVLYILYSFIIYSFGVHFNRLFLLYCLILGLSLYIFVLVIIQSAGMNVQEWVTDKIPLKTTGVYLIIIALLFYLIWLKDVVPAIINNSVPKSVSDYNLLVNPVHILDLAFALPGLIITAVLLMKKRKLGFVFTPVFLVFIILMALALAAMVVMLKLKGISEDLSVAVIFTILAVISLVILYGFLKAIVRLASTVKPEE
jgi:hypothetical protein